MSREYQIQVGVTLQLLEIATWLETQGLSLVPSRDGTLVAISASTPQEQVRRWGGDVEVELVDGIMEVCINRGNPGVLLAELLAFLRSAGIEPIVDQR